MLAVFVVGIAVVTVHTLATSTAIIGDASGILGGPTGPLEAPQAGVYTQLALLTRTAPVTTVSEGAHLSSGHLALESGTYNGNTVMSENGDGGAPAERVTFILPTNGYNWGKLHPYNAVDIANRCGADVVAAADGLVIRATTGGWHQGYGRLIDIEHIDGSVTRYAHLDTTAVIPGAHVVQGTLVGTVGNSGLTRGETGCHLHFEVRGAPNPFTR